MKLVLDAGLPPRLAKALVRKGHVAWHVTDCGMLEAKDRDIGRFAAEQGAVMVTGNSDFTAGGPPVVWLRLGASASGALEKALLAALPQIAAAIEAGEGLVEIR